VIFKDAAARNEALLPLRLDALDAKIIKPYFSKKTAQLEQLRARLIARLLKKMEDAKNKAKKKAAAAAWRRAAKHPRKKTKKAAALEDGSASEEERDSDSDSTDEEYQTEDPNSFLGRYVRRNFGAEYGGWYR
jgi:hypothetical protein